MNNEELLINELNEIKDRNRKHMKFVFLSFLSIIIIGVLAVLFLIKGLTEKFETKFSMYEKSTEVLTKKFEDDFNKSEVQFNLKLNNSVKIAKDRFKKESDRFWKKEYITNKNDVFQLQENFSALKKELIELDKALKETTQKLREDQNDFQSYTHKKVHNLEVNQTEFFSKLMILNNEIKKYQEPLKKINTQIELLNIKYNNLDINDTKLTTP